MKRQINKNFYIVYIDELNQDHRKGNKPAVIRFDGSIYFGKNGKYYRKGKPCIMYSDGTLAYYEHDEFVKIVQR